MRRFILCLILFALVLTICTVSTVSINKNACTLYDDFSDALDAVQRGDLAGAKTKVESCERSWDDCGLPFFVYLDHNMFNELEFLIHSIAVFLPAYPMLAAEQIQRCRAVLQNIMDQQQVNAENVF